MSLVINVIDYLIMLKYFRRMLGEREDKYKSVFALWGIVFILSNQYVNGFNNPYANLVYYITIVAITGLWYKEKVSIKIPMLLLYYGVCILADVFAAWILRNLVDFTDDGQASIYAMAFSVAVRYFLIEILCVIKKEKNMLLPKGTTGLVSAVLCLGIAASIGLNIGTMSKSLNLMGTVLAVSWLALLDFCMMLLLEKMNRIVRDNREKEMLLQEVRFNELYYSELEKSNLEFAKIRHDMKNRLSAFYHLEACDIEKMREGIQSLYNELDASKPDIVTRNRALNSILKIKFMQAEQEGIRVEHKIVVPDSLNMECGDMGILFGNIMDNAIEACRLCKEKEIELYTELKNNTLIIKVCNTKCKTQIGTIGKTSKKHADGHGIGLKSVRKIVNKYDGTMEMQDYGERFEVKMILYGVEGEGHGACRESRKVD